MEKHKDDARFGVIMMESAELDIEHKGIILYGKIVHRFTGNIKGKSVEGYITINDNRMG